MSRRGKRFLQIAGEVVTYIWRRYICEGPQDPASPIGWLAKKNYQLQRERNTLRQQLMEEEAKENNLSNIFPCLFYYSPLPQPINLC